MKLPNSLCTTPGAASYLIAFLLVPLVLPFACFAQQELEVVRTEVTYGSPDITNWHEFNDMLSPDVVLYLESIDGASAGSIIQVEPTTPEGYQYLVAHPYVGTRVSVPLDGGTPRQNFGIRSGSPYNVLNRNLTGAGGPPMGGNAPGEGRSTTIREQLTAPNTVVNEWAKNNLPGGLDFGTKLSLFLQNNLSYNLYVGDGPIPPWTHQVQDQVDVSGATKVFGKDTQVKGIPGEDVTFKFAVDSDIRFTPFRNISGYDGDTETFTYVTQAEDFSVYVPSNTERIEIVDNSGNYERIFVGEAKGIDFRDLTITGIDADSAAGTVNFLLGKGSKVDESGTRATQQAAFLKKVFLQALTVPKDEWRVSLPLNAPVLEEATQRDAVATSALKQTDFVDILFDADYRAKEEFVSVFSGSSTGNVHINLKFAEIACSLNSSLAKTMVEKYGVASVVPATRVRLTIIPELPNSEDNTSKIYIQDADIKIDLAVLGVEPRSDAYNEEEQNLIDAAISEYRQWLEEERFPTYESIIAERINDGVTPEYQALLDIYPALLAAEWYKQQDRGSLGGQFDYLIDQKLLGSSAEGVNISRNGSFDPSKWEAIGDGLGDAYSATSSCGITVSGDRVTAYGGVNANRTKISNDVITSARQQLINRGLFQPVLEEEEGNFFNAGAITANLPDLAIDNMSVEGAHGDSPIAALNTFVTFTVSNLGNVDASDIDFKIALRNMSTQEVTTTYHKVGGSVEKQWAKYLRYSLGKLAEGTYRVTVQVDHTYEKTEWNNFLTLEFDVTAPCETTKLNIPISYKGTRSALIYGCNVELSSEMSGTEGVRVRAKNKSGVKLLPGFSFKATPDSQLSIKAGWSSNSSGGNAASRIASTEALSAAGSFNRPEVTTLATNTRIGDTEALRKEKRKYLSKNLYRILPDSLTQSGSRPAPVALSEEDQEVMNFFQQIDYESDSVQSKDKVLYTPSLSSSNETLKIYPNPTAGLLNITHQLGDVSEAYFGVYSIDGKLVKKLDISDIGVKKNNLTIDVSSLQKGVYILKVKKNFSHESMFVKQ